LAEGLGSWANANRIKKIVDKAAVDAIEKYRPPLRSARIDSIDLVNKFAMVTFVGEVDSVKVPFNNVIPSYVGQWVRVGGTTNDRRIEEVQGDTAQDVSLTALTERVAALETRPIPGAYWFETTHATGTWRTTASPTRDPNFTNGTFVGWVNDPIGAICQNPGVYDVYGAWTYNGTNFTGSDDVYFEIMIKNASGGIKKTVTSQGFGAVTLNAETLHQFNAGDYIQVNLWSGKWRDHSTSDFLTGQWNRLGAKYVGPLPA
jgi:hypothetical protein